MKKSFARKKRQVLEADNLAEEQRRSKSPRPMKIETLLVADGSAPGLDNRPYGVYHYGAHFVALVIAFVPRIALSVVFSSIL